MNQLQQQIESVRKRSLLLMLLCAAAAAASFLGYGYVNSLEHLPPSSAAEAAATALLILFFAALLAMGVLLIWRMRSLHRLEMQLAAEIAQRHSKPMSAEEARAFRQEMLQMLTDQHMKNSKRSFTIAWIVYAAIVLLSLPTGGVLIAIFIGGVGMLVFSDITDTNAQKRLDSSVRFICQQDIIEALHTYLPDAKYGPQQTLPKELLEPLFAESVNQATGSDLISATYRGRSVAISSIELWHDFGEDAKRLLTGYAIAVRTSVPQHAHVCRIARYDHGNLKTEWVASRRHDMSLGAAWLPSHWLERVAEIARNDLRAAHVAQGWLVVAVASGRPLISINSSVSDSGAIRQSAANVAAHIRELLDAMFCHPEIQ